MAGNGSSNEQAAPSVNGRAYPIEDHTYDVIVIGAGGSGLRAVVGCAEREIRALRAVSDAARLDDVAEQAEIDQIEPHRKHPSYFAKADYFKSLCFVEFCKPIVSHDAKLH